MIEPVCRCRVEQRYAIDAKGSPPFPECQSARYSTRNFAGVGSAIVWPGTCNTAIMPSGPIPRLTSSVLSNSTFASIKNSPTCVCRLGIESLSGISLAPSDVATLHKRSEPLDQGSAEIEAVGVHHLGPRRHEVLRELLL